MTVRHININGEAVTEALYELDGAPSCARLFGHLTVAEMTEELARRRGRRAE